MDYEHDDRRAADVPGASGAEGSGLPAGREPLDAGSPSSRSPEVRAFDPHDGSGRGPSEMTSSGHEDDLFDAMFLSGGMRPPAFAAVDHDLGFPPPQGPDLASAFLAALDAIDDRRFVTPVPEEPPAAPVASVVAASSEPAYELRPQSRLELESEARPAPVDETSAAPAPVTVEGAEPLPWDTGRMPAASLTTGEHEAEHESKIEPEPAAAAHEPARADETWAFASYLESEADLQARASAAEETATDVLAAGALTDELEDELASEADEAAALTHAAVSAEEDIEESAYVEDSEPVEEAEYFGAGLVDDESEEEDDNAYVMALSTAGFDASLDSDSTALDSDGAALEADADVEADAVADALAGADAIVHAGAADAGDGDGDGADAVDADALAEAEALALALAEAEAELDAAVAAEPALDAMPDDEDFELEPSIGMEPMDAAPMAFDGPDAFAAPVSAAEPEPEPEPESDELEDLQDFVVFSLGDMRCVVPIRNVVEVGRIPDAAAVPNAPTWLYGLGNLRGQVLSLIDLRALFGVGRIKASAGRMVVLRGDADDITAGVMVDQVHQIVALSPSRFKEAPAELPLPDKSTEFVWGACDYGNFTMIGLDVDGVLGVENLTEETV